MPYTHRGRSMLAWSTTPSRTSPLDPPGTSSGRSTQAPEQQFLRGKNIALIFEKTSTRTGAPSRSPRTTRARASPISTRRRARWVWESVRTPPGSRSDV